MNEKYKITVDCDSGNLYIKECGVERPIDEWLDEKVSIAVYKHKIWLLTAINSGLIIGLFSLILMILTR